MKKFFTLIAACMAVMCINAQEWRATADAVASGSRLVDNSLVTITTANNDVTPTKIADESGNAAPKTYAGYTFDYYVAVRINNKADEGGDAVASATPTGGAQEGCVALVVTAKTDADVTLYYRRGDAKSISCTDQTNAFASVSVKENTSTSLADNGYTYYAGTYQFQAGHTYTVWAAGGTVQLNGIDTAAGTYVAPSNTIYQNASAEADADGISTITYPDGAQLKLLNSAKSWSGASSVTIDGSSYTTCKVSNGAQNKFIAPQGKYVTKVTFYSYVNKDAATTRAPYWKEVNGVAYDETTANIMQSYKDGANPDVNSYDLGGVSEFTFTNAGEQVCFVMVVVYGEQAGIKNVTADAANTVKKVFVNGQVVIEKNGMKYNAAGAQMK